MARAVLIVDDDAAFGDLAAGIVSRWGHLVVGLAGSVAGSTVKPLSGDGR